MSKPRLHEIDQAKGLAIFLVVLGHVCPRLPAFSWLQETVYAFHMHFFMFLSGLVSFYALQPPSSFASYGRYVSRRFMRLMPAYFLFGVAIILGKKLFRTFLHVDNLPDDFGSELIRLVLRREDTPVISLWYIYVLFIYQLCLPVLLKVSKNRVSPWVIVGLVLHFLPVPHCLSRTVLERIFYFAFPFFLGGLVSRNYEAWQVAFARYRAPAIGLFTLALALRVFFTIDRPSQAVLFVLLSVPALIGLMQFRRMANSEILTLLSKYTLAIYLMNSIAIGLTKGIVMKFVPLDGWRAAAIVPVLLIAGISLPILAKTRIFRFLPWLDKITT